jgi:glutamate---cysteine ligase / carboxylate-amine ligase
MWRAIRYGLAGELIDFATGDVVPARARLEELVGWVEPVAAEIGAAAFLAIPDANSAERQYARLRELGSHREVFAELVRRPRERVA